MIRDKGKSSGLVGKVAGLVLGGLASLMPSRADANIINVNSGMDVATINSTMAGANPGDTINFTKGKYDTGLNEHYHLMPDRNYTFANTIMHGIDSASGWMYEILEGGNINISGAQTIENINDGFWIGNSVYNNINISGVRFNVAEYGIVYDNIPHSSALTQAAINVNNGVAEGGEKMIKFYSSQTVSNLTPYASARNNSVKDLLSYMMDVPTYYSTNPGWVMLGNNEIEKNVLINSLALSEPTSYSRYSSPGDNANFTDVISPYLKENYDADPNNNITEINVKDSVGNFVTDDMRFVSGLIPGTLIPNRLTSPLVIRNEQGQMIDWIGAYKPMIPGDVNDDGFVGGADLNTVITNWGQSGVGWQGGDLTGDGLVGGSDYNNVLSNWGSGTSPGEPENIPEPATLGLILSGVIGAEIGRRWQGGRKKGLADKIRR